MLHNAILFFEGIFVGFLLLWCLCTVESLSLFISFLFLDLYILETMH